ncbi:MAG TPA: hypothetical protein VK447_04395 [Myxococcaceae bacterium]|nr:hypothetical protein [Myxococcaceae bacterium]
MPSLAAPSSRRLASRIALSLLSLGALACGPGIFDEPSLFDSAAESASAGDLAGARAKLAWLPETGAPRPDALLLQACIALEAGNFHEAEESSHALRALLPESAEPRVLEALISERRARPELPWSESYARAWNAAGRPDLRGSSLLPREKTQAPTLDIDRLWSADLAPETRLAIVIAGRANAEQLRSELDRLPVLPPALAIAVHQRLTGPTAPEDLRLKSTAVFRERLPALIASAPDAMDVRLVAMLDEAGPTEPFSDEDLSRLEEIAALPEWRTTDFAESHARLREHLEAAGVARASGWAFTGAVDGIATDAHYRLQQRAKASVARMTDSQRRRLGRALGRIGSRMAEESTILEVFLGSFLMKKGAELEGDAARVRELAAAREQVYLVFDEWQGAAIGSWPLYSLQEAVLEANVRNELNHIRLYAPAP